MLNFQKFVPVTVIAILCAWSSLVAQDDPLRTVNIVAPTAASLAKFVDYPVNYHTGIPEISFPIYTVKEGPLELPISLSYHAGGLKVMEYSSWVGAGFALHVGGVITRSVRSYADERARVDKSYLKDKGYFNYLYTPNGLDYLNFANGDRDGEPDLFFFNFNGYSGKFYFRPDGTPMLLPVSDLKITPLFCAGGVTGCNSGVEYLYGWIITTPDGVKYYFGKTTATSADQDAVERTEVYSPSKGLVNATAFSSWYLYKIESADSKYHIDLAYQREVYAQYSVATFPYTVGYSGGINLSGMEIVKNRITGVRLSSITYSGNVVSFVPMETPREDLTRYANNDGLTDYDNEEGKALKSIQIDDGDLCKRYDFTYSYFTSSTPLLSQYGTGNQNLATQYNFHTMKKRLKLDAFQEISCSGNEEIPKHVFSYYDETSVPSTVSLAQDHWGFYNGADGNTELLPSLSRNGGLSTTDGYGANRESAWPSMRAGTLKRITYPTGGYSEFTYRYHGLYMGATEKPVGGLRIEAITAQTAPEAPAKVTTFRYVNSDGVQGVLYSRPNYIALIRNDRLGESGMPISASPGPNDYWVFNQGCINSPPGTSINIAISPGSIHPMQTSQGNHFGYNEVTVVQPDGGYTLYKYTSFSNQAGDMSVKTVNINSCTFQNPNYPPAPLPHEFTRGVLRGVVAYDAGNRKLTEKIIDPVYTEEAVGVNGFIVEPSVYLLATEYELKTSKKTSETVTELTYTPGEAGNATPFGTVTESFFDSPYHAGLTKSITYEVAGMQENVAIKGEVLKEQRFKYVSDFKTPTQSGSSFCEDIAYSCDQNLVAAVNQERASYLADVSACTNRSCRFNRWQLYISNVNELRKTFVNTCRTNYLTDRKNCDQNETAYLAAGEELRALLDLKRQNQKQSLVESSSWRKGKFLGSLFITYKIFDSNRNYVFPSKRSVMDIAVPGTTFTPATNSSTAIIKASAYRQTEEYVYKSGKLSEVSSNSGGSTAYVWGYSDRYPVAKATQAGIGQVYYNGFELSGTTGEAASGTYYYNSGNFTVLFTPPSDGYVYKMSYWYWDSGVWKFSGELPFAGTISRGSRLDEIRVYPAGAEVTSYAYSEGRGISSSVDANGLRSFYNYDTFGRLINIKDNNGDVVKRYNYSYDVKQLED